MKEAVLFNSALDYQIHYGVVDDSIPQPEKLAMELTDEKGCKLEKGSHSVRQAVRLLLRSWWKVSQKLVEGFPCSLLCSKCLQSFINCAFAKYKNDLQPQEKQLSGWAA